MYIGGVAFRTIADRTLQIRLRVSPERLAGEVWRSLCLLETFTRVVNSSFRAALEVCIVGY